MMMEKLFETRYQVYTYSDKIPDENLVKEIINKTYKITASKQNIVPYKIHVLGPSCKEE